MDRLKQFLWRGRLRKAATIVVGPFVVLVIISAIASAFQEEDKSTPPASQPEATARKVSTPEPTATAQLASTPDPTNTPLPKPTDTPLPPPPTDTPVPPEPTESPAQQPPPQQQEPPPQANCHPSYEGACLEQGVGDWDCTRAGGGNGPNYVEDVTTGPVQVVGPDVFGLDRDDDGYGCE